MIKERFIEACQKAHIHLSDKQVEQLDLYRKMLQEANKVKNLTALISDEDVWFKHFLDSLLITPYLREAQTVCDVGTGAGFPGMVLAIFQPSLEVTLVEPTMKRVIFLNEVKDALGLKNVHCVNERAEDFVKVYRESFDFVCARAVANLNVLSELCLPLVRLGGVFLTMKGASGQEELIQARQAIKLLGGNEGRIHEDPLFDDVQRLNIEITKIAPTPAKYPRVYGKIKKNPLR